MLQKMGEHIYGWIAAVFVVIISVMFIFFSVSAYLTPSDPSALVLAKVNGEKLTAKMLSNQFSNAISADPSLASLGPQARLAYKKQWVDQWVEQQAISTTLHDAGMFISPGVIRNAILSTFQKNGTFSYDGFSQFMESHGYTNEMQVYQALSSQMLEPIFNQAISASVFALQDTVSRYFLLLTQQRSFRYSVIQSSSFQNQVSVSFSQLQAYYAAHLQDYLSPETLSVDYVKLSPASDQTRTSQDNDTFTAKSDQMVNLAYSNPESLEQVAKAMNLPIQTTEPFTRRGLKVGPASSSKFVSAAYGDIDLTQGINSDPVTLDDGSIVIMHLHKYTAAHTQPLASVEMAVKSAYGHALALQLAIQKAQALSDAINQNQKVALDWKTLPSVSVDDASVPYPLLQAVFDHPFAVGDKPISFAVPLSQDQVAVVQLQALHVMPQSAATPAQNQKIQQQLIDMQQNALLLMVKNSIILHSKIHVYPERIT
jgi:hypothetical protein